MPGTSLELNVLVLRRAMRGRCPLGNQAAARSDKAGGDRIPFGHPLRTEPCIESIAQLALGIIGRGAEFLHGRVPLAAPQSGFLGKGTGET